MKPNRVALVLSMVAAFAGCAADREDDPGAAASAAQDLTQAQSQAMQAEAVTTKELKKKYVLVGATSISGLDRDTIAIGGEEGAFTSMRLRVTGGALLMTDVLVTFGNGDELEPKVRLTFDDKTPTRDIDFPGNARFIRKIRFTALETKGDPVIEVWADKAAPRPRWVKLGHQPVNGLKDKDRIVVGGDEGRFGALQIRVKDSDLVMADVKVTFGNDEVFEPHVRYVFKEKSRSRAIDLPGEKRAIKFVDFTYGNLAGGGAADVELWGFPEEVEPKPAGGSADGG